MAFEKFKEFPRTFWIANTMELFERWAWYGLFAVLAIYLTGSTDEGMLGFSQSEKGLMMGVVTAILYLLPLITGAIADKVGYKKVLLLAYGILSSGYLLMGTLNSYISVFMVFLYIAIGAALFKPVISATVSKTTNESNSSIGFGIFYMMVNVGGFIGPYMASRLRVHNWNYVFYMVSAAIVANIILVLFFYKEPQREENNDSFSESLRAAFVNIKIVLSDLRYVGFLAIIVGFWTMFNQIFYTLPNFIEQWVDTQPLYDWIAGFSEGFASGVGESSSRTIPVEMIINLDAGLIVLFQVMTSAFVMRFKPLSAMFSGILVSAIGVGISFMTANIFFVLLGIFIFAFGEMASSPKFTEYIGLIAPQDKKALYMGTSFLPVAAGNFFAGIFSGPVYQSMSDKVTLLQQEVAKRGLQIPEISKEFTQNQYYAKAQELMNLDEAGLNQMLWDAYHPADIWYLFTTIGIITVIALIYYDKKVLSKIEKPQ